MLFSENEFIPFLGLTTNKLCSVIHIYIIQFATVKITFKREISKQNYKISIEVKN